jgi:hypothetical protein
LETRQSSFTPGALVGTMNTGANLASAIGTWATCATNVKWVSAEPVATTLAPLT